MSCTREQSLPLGCCPRNARATGLPHVNRSPLKAALCPSSNTVPLTLWAALASGYTPVTGELTGVRQVRDVGCQEGTLSSALSHLVPSVTSKGAPCAPHPASGMAAWALKGTQVYPAAGWGMVSALLPPPLMGALLESREDCQAQGMSVSGVCVFAGRRFLLTRQSQAQEILPSGFSSPSLCAWDF